MDAATSLDRPDTSRRELIMPNGRMVAGGVFGAMLGAGTWKIVVPLLRHSGYAAVIEILILLFISAAFGQIALGLLWRDHIPTVCRTCHDEVRALHARWGLACPRGRHYASIHVGRVAGAIVCTGLVVLLAVVWIVCLAKA